MEIALIQTGINWILGTSAGPYFLAFWAVLGALVMIASAIAPFTKTTKDDEIVHWLTDLIHRFSVIKPQGK